MKVWVGFGSEHSANLRMIGRFETAEKAESAKRQPKSSVTLVENFDYDGSTRTRWPGSKTRSWWRVSAAGLAESSAGVAALAGRYAHIERASGRER